VDLVLKRTKFRQQLLRNSGHMPPQHWSQDIPRDVSQPNRHTGTLTSVFIEQPSCLRRISPVWTLRSRVSVHILLGIPEPVCAYLRGLQASSPSTTTTTCTSSTTRPQEEETPHDQGTASPPSLVARARALQKQLSRRHELNICGDSYYIASVSVSKRHISLVINNSRHW
jgi:hypothetical protein